MKELNPQLLNQLLAYQLLCTHKLLGESKELHSFLFTNKLVNTLTLTSKLVYLLMFGFLLASQKVSL